MIKEAITEEERQCLRMWFRQAIAKIEQEEVTAAIREEQARSEGAAAKHKNHVARRRSRRSRLVPHLRELVF